MSLGFEIAILKKFFFSKSAECLHLNVAHYLHFQILLIFNLKRCDFVFLYIMSLGKEYFGAEILPNKPSEN